MQPKPLQQGTNSTDKVAPKPLGDLGQNGTAKGLCVCAVSAEQCTCSGGVKLRVKPPGFENSHCNPGWKEGKAGVFYAPASANKELDDLRSQLQRLDKSKT